MPPADEAARRPWSQRAARPSSSTSRTDNNAGQNGDVHAGSGSSGAVSMGNTYLNPFPSLSDAVAIRSPSRRDRRRNGTRSQINPYPTRESEINRLALEQQWNASDEERSTRTVHYGGDILHDPAAHPLEDEEDSHGPPQAVGTVSRVSFNRLSTSRRRPEERADANDDPLQHIRRRATAASSEPFDDEEYQHDPPGVTVSDAIPLHLQLELLHRELLGIDETLKEERLRIKGTIAHAWHHFTTSLDSIIRHFSPIKNFDLDFSDIPSFRRDVTVLEIDEIAARNLQKFMCISPSDPATLSEALQPGEWIRRVRFRLPIRLYVDSDGRRDLSQSRRRLMALFLWRHVGT